MDIAWIRQGFIAIALLDGVLFLGLLLRKGIRGWLDRGRETLRAAYEAEIIQGLQTERVLHGNRRRSILERTLGRGVLRTLLLAYASFLTGESRQRLHAVLQRTGLEQDLKRQLRSLRLHVRKTAAYEAGAMGLAGLEGSLLPLLQSRDRELFYITAKSLVKLTGKKHLGFILYKAADGALLRKNQVLTLFESLEEEVEELLDKVLRMKEQPAIVAAALEIFGIRQLHSGMEWIMGYATHPNKEIRIAALKGASAMGDPGDTDYRNTLLSLWEDEAWEVRAFLARYLRQVRSKKSRYTLAKFLRDDHWQVRMNAAEALADQGEEGVRILWNLQASKEETVRNVAWGVLHRRIVTEDLLARTEDVNLVMKLMRRLRTLSEKEVTVHAG